MTSARTPRLAYQAALLGRSIEELGAKWTLLILRDVTMLGLDRFGLLLRNNPGLTPRVLSRRLRSMASAGLLQRGKRDGRYRPTAKGEEALQVLRAHLRFALRHHADLNPGLPDPVGGWHVRRSTPSVRIRGGRRLYGKHAPD